MLLRTLPADDPGLVTALAEALDGGRPLAPLPPEPASTLAMLRPEVPVAEPDAALVVATSGSTGTPKGVVLSAEAVRAGADATHERLGGTGDWVLTLPAHYVAGVMVIARALVAGTRLLPCSPRLDDLPEVTGRTYLSVVPTQLVRALDDPATTERLARFAAVLVGGAALDVAVRERCRGLGINAVTTYGMSETAGGCVYDGVPLAGVEIRLGERDRISLGGPMVFSGYRLRPDLTEQTLVDGRVVTQDRGRWVGDRLEVLGRLDDVVVSGGVNVDLAAVERAVLRHWPEAAVVGVPDDRWGTRVVVAGVGLPALAGVRETLDELEPAARPLGLMRLDVLPRTSSDKVDRQRLIATWPDPPTGTVKEQL